MEALQLPLCFCVGCLYASVTRAFGRRPEIDLYTDRVFIKTAEPCCFSIWPCIKTEESVDTPLARRTVFPHSGTIDLRNRVCGGDAAPPDRAIPASFNFAASLPTEMMLGRQTITAAVGYFTEAPAIQKCS